MSSNQADAGDDQHLAGADASSPPAPAASSLDLKAIHAERMKRRGSRSQSPTPPRRAARKKTGVSRIGSLTQLKRGTHGLYVTYKANYTDGSGRTTFRWYGPAKIVGSLGGHTFDLRFSGETHDTKGVVLLPEKQQPYDSETCQYEPPVEEAEERLWMVDPAATSIPAMGRGRVLGTGAVTDDPTSSTPDVAPKRKAGADADNSDGDDPGECRELYVPKKGAMGEEEKTPLHVRCHSAASVERCSTG